MNNNELKAYFLTGCTAAGKTSVAHFIAKQKGYAILSTDSMQVYRDMNIGTAKASSQELSEVPYYGIDICDPNENYSLWNFYQYSKQILRENSNKTFIITGGTGLYIKSLMNGLNELPGADAELRTHWNTIIESNGIKSVQDELNNHAPEYFARMSKDDQENPRRLIRAIELVRAPQYQKNPRAWIKTTTKINLVGVSLPTDILNNKIAKRVHKMYDEGLIDEVNGILNKYQDLNGTAAQAIGYAEAIALIRNQYSLEEAIEKTIVRTRRLAKKQRTWFRHQAQMDWVDKTDLNMEQTADLILRKWDKHGQTNIV